jgi:hypothetical protein
VVDSTIALFSSVANSAAVVDFLAEDPTVGLRGSAAGQAPKAGGAVGAVGESRLSLAQQDEYEDGDGDGDAPPDPISAQESGPLSLAEKPEPGGDDDVMPYCDARGDYADGR